MSRFRRLFASTRVRITALAVAVVGVALAGGGFVLHTSLHHSSLRAVRGSAALQVRWVEDLGASGTLPLSLPAVDASRLTLVQVVDSDGRVIASSPQLAGVDYDADDEGGDRVRAHAEQDDHHRLRGGPWFVDTAPATVGGRTVKVVAYTSLSDYEQALHSVDRALAVTFPLLLALVAAVTWWLVGRSLRPVERMRREVDAITAGSLDSRVDEPPSTDEVGRLAVTLNSMLERLQRSADRQRRFIADASHELRTPVANVGAALDVARRYPDRTDWVDVAGDVAAQNQRMARLVDDLLLVARTEHADPESVHPSGPVVLADLVRAEVGRLGSDAQAMVVVAEPLADVVVDADAQQLERVVANLLENATRHAEHRVEVDVSRDGVIAVITVSDDGPGIPAGQRERVFEPFVRLDEHRARAGGGAGLGLAIVRDLVAANGGTVTVGDGPGGGAMFVVRLPATLSA